MKVTVCFGSVRVIVPCGNGELLVSDLIKKAIVRYKKAVGKPNDYWVLVHTLKTCSDGGILDPDDQLSDVADDREQIIALYDEQDPHPVHHNGGDGTSASSQGTSSPDIFQNSHVPNSTTQTNNNNNYGPAVTLREGGKNDVLITTNDLSSGSALIVRRGSEPALNTVGTNQNNKINNNNIKSSTSPTLNKRWSGIAGSDDTKQNPRISDNDNDDPHPGPRLGGSGQEKSAFSRFARDSTRQSLASNSSAMIAWLEAQQQDRSAMGDTRKDPVGGSGLSPDDTKDKENNGTVITLKNEPGPLGIHVVPDYDETGREVGLLVQTVESGGRIHRDGCIHVQDRIIEINDTSLVDVDFYKAQEIFRNALQAPEVHLRIVKNAAPPLPKQPPPVLPKPDVRKKPDNLNLSDITNNLDNTVNDMEHGGESSSAPKSPNKKTPPAPPVRHPSTSLTSPLKKNAFTAPTNTRRIGKKLQIQLTKGPEGLGFSITTRDNPAGGPSPIYIKNILPKGAAIQDGNLKPGDRLLEVNDMVMTGKTQSEAVAILRTTRPGSVVTLLVSRQEMAPQPTSPLDEKFSVPRELPSSPVLQPSEKAMDDGFLATSKNKQILSFDIPLNDTGSAGLGVSVKGKTSSSNQGIQDLGIFIKAVISGGAASKDGSLRINDQLLRINGESLIGKTNSESMETLRTAMQKDGPVPGHIHIVVARRIGPPTPSPSTPNMLNTSQSPDLVMMTETSRSSVSPERERPSSAKITNNRKLVDNNNYLNKSEPDVNSESKDTVDHPSKDTSVRQQAYQDVPRLRNPVLDRLTGVSSSAAGLRNESYSKAVHDSFNDSHQMTLLENSHLSTSSSNDSPEKHYESRGSTSTPNTTATAPAPRSAPSPSAPLSSPTIRSPHTDSVMIDDHHLPLVHRRLNPNPKARPASTLGFLRPNPGANQTSSPLVSRSNENLEQDSSPKPPDWLTDWDSSRVDDSQALSPIPDPAKTFQREGFGRQSISEKRHAHKDPQNGDFYQKVKAKREESAFDHRRSASYHGRGKGPLEIGPGLGMKKSSSLESLQAMVEDAGTEDSSNNLFRPPNRVVRGRGCNESFRAAVDRSYDEAGLEQRQPQMDTLEEESSESGSVSKHSVAQSTHSSGSDNIPKDDKKQGLRRPKSAKDKTSNSSLFKGLGNMFRFGKNRKVLDERPSKVSSGSLHSQQKMEIEDPEKARAHQAAREEQERIQEQYRKLQEKQRQMDRLRQQQVSPPAQPPSGHGQAPDTPPQSRAERIQQIRTEHQRRHRERQGHYPTDRNDEQFEKELQSYERSRIDDIDGGTQIEYRPPPRRRPDERSFDSQQSSRQPQADPRNYSHYQNQAEIQAQLNRHDYYQNMYRQQQQGTPVPPYVPTPHPQYTQTAPYHPIQAPAPRMPAPRGADYTQNNSQTIYAQPWAHHPRVPPPPNYDHRQGGGDLASSRSHGHKGRILPTPPTQGSPPRPRSQTPINQMGYLSHSNNKRHMGPTMASQTGNHQHQRPQSAYLSSDCDDPRQAYMGQTNYGSLPRRYNGHHRDNIIVSGSAQV